MTNAELLAKIKAEIERQRKFIEGMFIEGDNNFYDGQDDAYNNILTFLSTLESEKPMQDGFSKEFDDEFRRFIKKEKEEEPDGSLPAYGDYGIYRIARHFAEWGAEH